MLSLLLFLLTLILRPFSHLISSKGDGAGQEVIVMRKSGFTEE